MSKSEYAILHSPANHLVWRFARLLENMLTTLNQLVFLKVK
jgi:hypothetical protein